jgi:hypothetical protein
LSIADPVSYEVKRGWASAPALPDARIVIGFQACSAIKSSSLATIAAWWKAESNGYRPGASYTSSLKRSTSGGFRQLYLDLTSVCPSRWANSSAAWTASSKALASSSVCAASLACDRLVDQSSLDL